MEAPEETTFTVTLNWLYEKNACEDIIANFKRKHSKGKTPLPELLKEWAESGLVFDVDWLIKHAPPCQDTLVIKNHPSGYLCHHGNIEIEDDITLTDDDHILTTGEIKVNNELILDDFAHVHCKKIIAKKKVSLYGVAGIHGNVETEELNMSWAAHIWGDISAVKINKNDGKEHPIHFNPEMAAALWNGNKTQTRRKVKQSHKAKDGNSIYRIPTTKAAFTPPHGCEGGKLWVKESYRVFISTNPAHANDLLCNHYTIEYKAGAKRDVNVLVNSDDDKMLKKKAANPSGKWQPSIFMPKILCRLYLDISEIRIERLQNITEEDAKAEGAVMENGSYVEDYKRIWEKIDGIGSWDIVEFVWVYVFTVRKVC